MKLLKETTLPIIILGITLTSCSSVKEASFNDEYINKYKGEYKVEIPEAYELIKVMVALTEVGQIDSNMVDMTTEYYQDVMNHFSVFEDHKQIRKMNRKIKKPEKFLTYINYLFYRWNALGYVIDENNKIVHNKEIPQKQFLIFRDPIRKNQKHINDFIAESNFRSFYSDHKNYYDSLTLIYKDIIPIDKMTNWLTAKFPTISYDSYKIICSPLVNGTHYTEKFSSNGFSQTIMSVCPIFLNNKYSTEVNEMRNSRIVFTEIDHNFVNLISDKYAEKIDEVLNDLDVWRIKSSATKAYESPYRVFNEYMTWALFSLYCIDNFEEKDYEVALSSMERTMVKGRDFIKFKEFNRKLIEIYTEGKINDIDKIYSQMLDWCMNKNT